MERILIETIRCEVVDSPVMYARETYLVSYAWRNFFGEIFHESKSVVADNRYEAIHEVISSLNGYDMTSGNFWAVIKSKFNY